MAAAETLPLEAFLAALPDEAAGGARAAAARIDAIERAIAPPNWIERNLLALATGALALFLLGIAAFIGAFAGLRGAVGLGGVTLMVVAFPALVFAYVWSVRPRTAADHRKMVLNETHFLPHGGLYFGDPAGSGMVVRVERKVRELNLKERTEALHARTTRRRW